MSEDISEWYEELNEKPLVKRDSIFSNLFESFDISPKKYFLLKLGKMPPVRGDKARTAKNTYGSLIAFVKKHYEGKYKVSASGQKITIEKLEPSTAKPSIVKRKSSEKTTTL